MNNVDNCDDEWTVKGSKNTRSINVTQDELAFGELVMRMCDHHEGLSPTEVDILYKEAMVFVKAHKKVTK